MSSKALFNVPSGATATVKIIDSTLRLSKLPSDYLMTPSVEGFSHMPTFTTWSFLIESASGQKALFDLGVPPDIETHSPAIIKRIKNSGWDVRAEKHVADILSENGVRLAEINSVIWRYEILRSNPSFKWLRAVGGKKLTTKLLVTGIGITLVIRLLFLRARSLSLAQDSKMRFILVILRSPMLLCVSEISG